MAIGKKFREKNIDAPKKIDSIFLSAIVRAWELFDAELAHRLVDGSEAAVTTLLLSDGGASPAEEISGVAAMRVAIVVGPSLDSFLTADDGRPIIGWVILGLFGSIRTDISCSSVLVVSSCFRLADGGLEPAGAVVELFAMASSCFRFADGGLDPITALTALLGSLSSGFLLADDGLEFVGTLVVMFAVVSFCFWLADGGLAVIVSRDAARVWSPFTADPGRVSIVVVGTGCLFADGGRSFGVNVDEIVSSLPTTGVSAAGFWADGGRDDFSTFVVALFADWTRDDGAARDEAAGVDDILCEVTTILKKKKKGEQDWRFFLDAGIFFTWLKDVELLQFT